MPRHDELYELIHSLTPSEKRYFKLHADRYITDGYKNQYEKLYDALNHWSREEFDEKEFRKMHRGKVFLKNLSFEKSYLKSLLLKTLRSYHSDSDDVVSLHEMLLDIRLLISKGLKQQAHSLIERAMHIAQNKELFNEMLLLNDFLIDLSNVDADTLLDGKEMAQVEEGILRKMTDTRRAIHLRTTIIEIHRQGAWHHRQKEVSTVIAMVESLWQNPDLSRRAEISLLIARQHYLIHRYEYTQALELTADWLYRIENAPNGFAYTPDHYRATLANYLLCILQCEQFELMPAVIEKLKKLKLADERTAADCFRVIAQYELVYLLNMLEFDGADGMLDHIEQGMKKYKSFISEKHTVQMRFNIALFHFLQKKYSHSLDDIAHLLHVSGRDERYSFTTAMARFMEWMCHCSMGNFGILDSSLRNLKRYFDTRDDKEPFFKEAFDLCTCIVKEANIRHPSLEKIKNRLLVVPVSSEWSQLKAIFLEWIN